jgi:hypothetical protein
MTIKLCQRYYKSITKLANGVFLDIIIQFTIIYLINIGFTSKSFSAVIGDLFTLIQHLNDINSQIAYSSNSHGIIVTLSHKTIVNNIKKKYI